ncbi:MAG: hypothetical protein QOD26_1192 [Betaproteobacteria bacterium]|jgi:hypothetical protein|nr:hypothetical protein [Betaproteobacteria bacterium]
MYVKKIVFENYGPIHRFAIDLSLDDGGRPKLVVLVGQNGAGKSLVLSGILESLIEAKRQAYQVLPEVPKDEYFRLQKKDYIRAGQDYSYLEVQIGEGDGVAKLLEVVRQGAYEAFQAKYPAAEYPHLQINDQYFQESGFHKVATVPKTVQDSIKKQVSLYFPYFRYEPPAWLNPAAGPRMETRLNMYGQSTESIVKTNIVRGIESWILDLILDMELYEKHLIPVPGLPEQHAQVAQLFIGYRGRNATTRDLLNQLLTGIYRAKDPTVTAARIGISSKAGRRVSILVARGATEELLAPTISHLSSGELMAFSIGATILREHDQLNSGPAEALADISGITLIDEADLHLHIRFQKEVLPSLFRLFPKVQFIVTTHSPFFLLGLSQAGDIPHTIYELPHGEILAAEDFVEFRQAYDTFIQREQQFKDAYDGVTAHLKNLQRPLVITEGSTDWKHMKSALTRLRANGEYLDLDFEFHEYTDGNMGDASLRSMCEQFSKVRQLRRVVFIFDRDDPRIVQAMEDGAVGFRDWGNNVLSFCIPKPAQREQYQKITIESYYTDGELRTPDPATGYRLVFSNEIQKIIETSLTHKGASVVKVQLRAAPVEAEEFDKAVYDQDAESIVDAAGSRVAHSKTVFAERVASATPPFRNFDLANFHPLFDRLRQVLTAQH